MQKTYGADTPRFGATSGYMPFCTFSEDIQSYGVFIYTGGKESILYNCRQHNHRQIKLSGTLSVP